jgi:hypothetical protein
MFLLSPAPMWALSSDYEGIENFDLKYQLERALYRLCHFSEQAGEEIVSRLFLCAS